MDKELKSKWIEALRSGKYKQGRGLLRGEDNKFCCLGVLCDIIDPDKWINNYKGSYGFGHQYKDIMPSFDHDDKFCGISAKTVVELSVMNDGRDDISPRSFREIADWIESNIK